jgi:LysM repeat protein
MIKSLSLLLAIVSITTFSAKAEKMDSLRMEIQNGKNVVVHRADAGQTLFSLLRRYGSSIVEFRKLNPDEDVNLKLGKVYLIPYGKPLKKAKVSAAKNNSSLDFQSIVTESAPTKAKPATAQPVNAVKSMIVQPGQYLYSISKQTGHSVNDIKRWNNLESNDLKVGQILYFGKVVTKNIATVEDIEKDLLNDDPAPRKKSNEIVVIDIEANEKEAAQKEAAAKKLRDKKREEELRLDEDRKIAAEKATEKREADLKAKKDSALKAEANKNKETDLRKAALEGTSKTEEGIAEILDIESRVGKYLALHKTAPNGTLVQVTNLGNGAKAWVKVIGKIPNTSENENTIIIMNKTVMEKLGASNTKRFRSTINYTL